MKRSAVRTQSVSVRQHYSCAFDIAVLCVLRSAGCTLAVCTLLKLGSVQDYSSTGSDVYVVVALAASCKHLVSFYEDVVDVQVVETRDD
jgi:hypothetical protein